VVLVVDSARGSSMANRGRRCQVVIVSTVTFKQFTAHVGIQRQLTSEIDTGSEIDSVRHTEGKSRK
jgi:hypothetical protein